MRIGFVLSFALLAACAPESSDKLPLDAAALPQDFTGQVSPHEVQSVQRDFEVLIAGAPVNALMALFWSDGQIGSGPCPGFFQGECLDITAGTTGANFFMLPRADSVGDVVLQTRLPRSVPPGNYVMQAVALSGGQFTASAPFEGEFIAYQEDCAVVGPNEPNDSAIGGTTVMAGDTSMGNLCYGDRIDWYAVDLDVGEQLAVDLTFSQADGDVDIYLMTGAASNHEFLLQENSVAQGFTDTDNEYIQHTATASRVHYVAVHLYEDNGADGAPYDISFNIAVP